MACSMMKKGILGATLGAGALYLAFGHSAPSYLRTGFHRFRASVKHEVSPQFEIDRARDEIASLEPSLHTNLENFARAEYDVQHLDREIASTRSNLGTEKAVMVALRSSLESGNFKLAGNATYTADEVKAELKQRLDSYKEVSELLKAKEETLKAKQKAMVAARKQLAQTDATKKALLTKLSGIEARLKMIEATRQSNEFNFDDSALSRAKSSVADLEKRLDVMARTAELEGRFSNGTLLPVGNDLGRDVLKEMDAEFGPAAPKGPAAEDKSL